MVEETAEPSEETPQLDRGTLAETLEGTLNVLEAASNRDNPAKRVPTGVEELDDLLGGGMWPGHLVVIGGRTSTGTSTLALNLVRSAAIDHHLPTLLFSPDTSVDEVNIRLGAATGKVPVNHLRNGYMSDDDWNSTGKTFGSIAGAPITIDSRPRLTLDDLTESFDEAVAAGTKLVVLDSIQALVPLTPRDSRYHELCEQVHTIKRLARIHRIPVVVTSKLNRVSESRPDRVPQLHDLRNAGDIEDVADVVILIHRDDLYEAQSTRPGTADLIVAKHRHGPTRDIVVAFQGHYARFADMKPEYREEQRRR